jgi:hypothetical protein
VAAFEQPEAFVSEVRAAFRPGPLARPRAARPGSPPSPAVIGPLLKQSGPPSAICVAITYQRRWPGKRWCTTDPGRRHGKRFRTRRSRNRPTWWCGVDTTTICGTDLHILHGDVAAVTDGRILGHEAVGTVAEVGDAVKGFAAGDRVLVPAITKCGRYCQRGMPSHCQTVGGIGWIFGHLIDGTQAESVRVPYADTSLYAVPANVTKRAGHLPRRLAADRV